MVLERPVVTSEVVLLDLFALCLLLFVLLLGRVRCQWLLLG